MYLSQYDCGHWGLTSYSYMFVRLVLCVYMCVRYMYMRNVTLCVYKSNCCIHVCVVVTCLPLPLGTSFTPLPLHPHMAIQTIHRPFNMYVCFVFFAYRLCPTFLPCYREGRGRGGERSSQAAPSTFSYIGLDATFSDSNFAYDNKIRSIKSRGTRYHHGHCIGTSQYLVLLGVQNNWTGICLNIF